MSSYREVAVSRVQLALNVDNLDESIAFYSKLFGTGPAKLRPGYANFAIAEPPLKLVLLENPGQGGSLNHLGVEVADTATVDAEQTRLAGAGLASVDERATTCCYAKQDKFWVQGTPDGERWEIYAVTGDSQTFWGEEGSTRYAAVEAALDGAPEPLAQCCGGQNQAGAEAGASASGCC
jgi:catechol 2,3-dioxygenase-like lactoylglutathione lyase family enzyme